MSRIIVKRDNPFLSGMRPEDVRFENNAQMIEAMQNPLYKTNGEYRDVVAQCLANDMGDEPSHQQPQEGGTRIVSGRELSRAMSDPAGARKLEDQAILREQSAKMFNAKDEQGRRLMEVSPTYRRQVDEWLIANTPMLDALIGDALIDRSARQKSFKIQLGTDGDAFTAGKEAIRLQKVEQAKVAAQARHEVVDEDLENDMEEIGAERK